MKRKKLTLDALVEISAVLDVQEQLQIVGGGSGTPDDPYTMQEVDPLIDKGTFEGGYVRGADGSVTRWLGVLNVYANSSSDDGEDEVYDFNSRLFHEVFGANSDNSGSGYSGNSGSDYPSNPDSSMSSGFTIPRADGLEDAADYLSTTADAVASHAGKTRVGGNCKFYFETRSGRVFYGNQYVGTTSLAAFGKTIGHYAQPVNWVLSAYNVGATTFNEGWGEGLKEGAKTVGGMAGAKMGAFAGGKLGAAVGSWAGPAGTAIGGISGAVIGGIGGAMGGSYIIEISIDW